jgi:hypothetical protein
MVVGPELVALLTISVPVPALVSAPAPLPSTMLAVIVKVLPLVSMVPPVVLILISLPNDRLFAAALSAPPSSVTRPVPSESALPIAIAPAEMVVPAL